MANGTGTATIDFGAFPGSNEASVVVTGIGTIGALAKAEAFFMMDTTSDHTANDHAYAALLSRLTCGTVVAAIGFTAFAKSLEKLQGTFSLQYVWSD